MTLENVKKLFKFSWSQALSDHCGKSSILLVAGWYQVLTGGLILMYGAITKDPNTLIAGTAQSVTGAGLLGYKKKVDGKSVGEFPEVTEEGATVNKQTIEQVTTLTETTAPEANQ